MKLPRIWRSMLRHSWRSLRCQSLSCCCGFGFGFMIFITFSISLSLCFKPYRWTKTTTFLQKMIPVLVDWMMKIFFPLRMDWWSDMSLMVFDISGPEAKRRTLLTGSSLRFSFFFWGGTVHLGQCSNPNVCPSFSLFEFLFLKFQQIIAFQIGYFLSTIFLNLILCVIYIFLNFKWIIIRNEFFKFRIYLVSREMNNMTL